MIVINVYIYGVEIIEKFRWESGFLSGKLYPFALTEVSDSVVLTSYNRKKKYKTTQTGLKCTANRGLTIITK